MSTAPDHCDHQTSAAAAASSSSSPSSSGSSPTTNIPIRVDSLASLTNVVQNNTNHQQTTATTTATATATSTNIQGNSQSEVQSCGICFEDFPAKEMALLLCCRQRLCMTDVQKVGICPFCRCEPVMWI